MSIPPDPGWKGQPPPVADYDEDELCCDCGGRGYLPGQTYGECDVPDDFVSVQRCDICLMFDGDKDAARAYALERAPGASVQWFAGISDVPGDWAVGPIDDNEGRT